MKANTSKTFISKDILFYLPAKLIEGIVGLLTLNLYTKLFTAKVIGEYGLVNPTVAVTFLILLGWLMHGIYRYVNAYKEKDQLAELYTTSIVSYLLCAGVVGLGIIGLVMFNNPWFSNTLLLSAFYLFVAYGLAQIMLNLLVALKKIKLNLLLSVGSAIGKLILTIILAVYYKKEVTVILISHGTMDLCVALIIFLRLNMHRYFVMSKFSRETLKTMLNFGYPLIGLSLTMFVLNQSDRYIIKYYHGEAAAGIYFANYSLASAIYMMMIMGIMRAVYPNLLLAWQQKDKEKATHLLSGGVRYYLMLCIPATVGIVLLAKPISYLVLDVKVHGYSKIVAWTAIGMLFFGLTEYCNKAWELTGKTKTILYNSLISGIINIALNFILVPRYGFYFAAVTTVISFATYLLLSYIGARRIFIWHVKPGTWLRILLSAATFGTVIWIIGQHYTFTVLILTLTIILSIIIYFTLLLLTGELKEEMKMLKKIKKK